MPGLPSDYAYGYQIPILVITPQKKVLAFAQAYVVHHQRDDANSSGSAVMRLGATSGDGSADGNDGWIDIVARRGLGSMDAAPLDDTASGDKGPWRPGPLQVIFRNSSLATKEFHACQQPTPVVDHVTGKILLLSSLDNWHMRLQESTVRPRPCPLRAPAPVPRCCSPLPSKICACRTTA